MNKIIVNKYHLYLIKLNQIFFFILINIIISIIINLKILYFVIQINKINQKREE